MTRITDSNSKSSSTAIKFLYSYGGKIMPRQIDGELRYVGGHTRVLAVDRSVSFAELIVKFWESCGFSVNLKCKLPNEDLDLLVSVTCEEDLVDIVEEYDRVSPGTKIRVVLFPIESLKTISPVPSVDSLVEYSASKPPLYPKVGKFAAKGTQQRSPVDFSAYKLRQHPVTGFGCANPPMASAFREPEIAKQDYFVTQFNHGR